MSSSKTLFRTGVSLMNRLIIDPILQGGGATHQIPSRTFEITPKIFPPPVPSLSKFQTSLNFPQNHSETLDRLSSEGFLYPCELPSLEFFLPDGDDYPSNEPMLCIKRTYQPSTLRRKRNHGYLARKATKGGRRVCKEDC